MGGAVHRQRLQELEEERLVPPPGALEEGLHLSAEMPEPGESPLLEQVNALPPKYRQVLYLRYYEGYQVKEIAELLGQSPALVSTHLARARAKLRERLEGSCYDG